jgi:hypothetical protein
MPPSTCVLPSVTVSETLHFSVHHWRNLNTSGITFLCSHFCLLVPPALSQSTTSRCLYFSSVTSLSDHVEMSVSERVPFISRTLEAADCNWNNRTIQWPDVTLRDRIGSCCVIDVSVTSDKKLKLLKKESEVNNEAQILVEIQRVWDVKVQTLLIVGITGSLSGAGSGVGPQWKEVLNTAARNSRKWPRLGDIYGGGWNVTSCSVVKLYRNFEIRCCLCFFF